jgi:cyclin D5
MGDAAAAAASTSAPDTPTSILICREDGSDLLADADDGADADIVVARDERLLVVDPDEEYVALLLSEESASGSGGRGAQAEEMEEWMKVARSGCVSWIIKVVRAGALPPCSSPKFGFFSNVHLFFLCCSQTTATFRCGGKTAYVAVTYLDRFLTQRRVNVTTDQ